MAAVQTLDPKAAPFVPTCGGNLLDRSYSPGFSNSPTNQLPSLFQDCQRAAMDFQLPGSNNAGDDVKYSYGYAASGFPQESHPCRWNCPMPPTCAEVLGRAHLLDRTIGPPPGLPAPPGLAVESTLGLGPFEVAEKARTLSTTCSPEGKSSGASSEPEVPPGTVTAMLRNIPHTQTQDSLLRSFHSRGYATSIDFLYLPMNFKNRCNFGYAFINFRTAEGCAKFVADFHNSDFRDRLLDSEGPGARLEVWPARHQGLEENVHQLSVSPVLTELLSIGRPDWLPKIFNDRGEDIDFPLPAELPVSSRNSRRRRVR